jgi:hypothetical protein
MTKMMKIMSAITLIGLVGCAKGPETSNLKVSIAAATGSAQFPGGLYLMGKHQSGKQFMRVLLASDNIQLELENGKWDFATIGWDSPSQNFEGNSFCGMQQGLELKGSEIDLALKATKANCSNPIFGKQVSNNEFYPLQFHTCGAIQDRILKGSDIPAGLECGPTNSYEMFSGGLKSFKISMVQKLEDGSIRDGLSSRCISDIGSDAKELSDIRLPHGSSFLKFPYIIKGYSAAGCSVGDLESVYQFRDGFNAPAVDGLGTDVPDGTGSILNVYLHSDLCTQGQELGNPFAATQGTNHLICTGDQFERIGQSSTEEDTFILGKDINFGGSNTTIPFAFSGELEGDNFTLSNGNSPLFSSILSTNSKEVSIEDLFIDDFQINITSSANGFGFGILTQLVTSDGTGNEIRISDIEITNSKIEITDVGGISGSAVGGLIGEVTFSNSGVDENLEIREVSSFATVDGVINPAIKVGGLIGKAVSDDDSGEIRIEYCEVGVNNPGDLKDISARSTILGGHRVGGLIGQAEYVEIRNGNKVVASMKGEVSMGGLIGEVRNKVNVENSETNILFNLPNLLDSDRVGGAIGNIATNGNFYIDGVITRLDIPRPDTTVQQLTNLGGIVGSATSINHDTASGVLRIKNSRAYTTAKVNGSKHGGFIGSFSDAKTGATPSSEIVSSVAMGRLSDDDNDSGNTKKGGFVGEVTKLLIKLSIADMDKMEGYNNLGGAYGSASAAKVEESFLKTEIECLSTGTLYCGGIVGSQVFLVGDIPLYQNIKSDVDLQIPNVSPGDCVNKKCGRIVGYNANSGITFDRIIAIGEISAAVSGDSNTECGAGNCSTSTNITDTLSSDASCGGLTGEFLFGSKCELVFEQKWEDYGRFPMVGDANYSSNYYLAGNRLEPFPIMDEANWNGIGNDKLLMGKHFILTRNLNFLAPPYNPIGDVSNRFSGGIIPNGKTLSNLGHTAGTMTPGLFPYVDGGKIGVWGDPLKILGSTLNCEGYGSCGIVGTSNNAELKIQAKGIIIQSSGGDGIGGFVGHVVGHTNINESSFEGSINATANKIGGLVGDVSISGGTDKLNIENSKIALNLIKGNANIGGIIGQITEGGSNVRVSNSYITHKDFNAGVSGGGLLGYSAGGSANFDTVYLDTRSLNVTSGLFHTISGASGITPSLNMTYNVHPTGLSNTNGAPTGVVSKPGDLDNNDFEQGDSHSDWAMDSGILKLAWEVYGFKN